MNQLKKISSLLCVLLSVICKKLITFPSCVKIIIIMGTPTIFISQYMREGMCCIIPLKHEKHEFEYHSKSRCASFYYVGVLFGQAWQLPDLSTRRTTECPQTRFEKPRKRDNLCLFGEQHFVDNYCSLLGNKTLVLPKLIGFCYLEAEFAQKPYSANQRQ
jgi:hypothetical protein